MSLGASMTPAAILVEGATVVSAFGGLILLVSALGIGVFVVRFIVGQVRKARA